MDPHTYAPTYGRRSVKALAYVTLLGLLVQVPGESQEAASASATIAGFAARLSELDPRVQHLKDRHDIFDASKRYTRGADRHDKDLVRSAFWPDATIGYGTVMSRDEYVDAEEAVLAGFAAHQHHITGQTVELDGDTAHVESYVIYFLVPRDTSADLPGPATPGRALVSDKTYLGSGRYVERWEKRDGEWRILVREYVEDLALEGETVDVCGRGTCLGTWDRNDLSYVRPLEHVSPEERRARAETNAQPRHPNAGVAPSESAGGRP